MRLLITLANTKETVIPIDHGEYLTALVYNLLERSDADYSRFLHEEGYAADESSRRFKLFVFSGLRARSRKLVGDTLHLGPGPVEWSIASPVGDFVTNFATGILQVGVIAVGRAVFPVARVETLADPDFSGGKARFICLSPIVAAVRSGPGNGDGTRYLTPADGEELTTAIRNNLARKLCALAGPEVEPGDLAITFDQDYLDRRRGGTKLVTYKEIQIRGTLAPFTATGSPALLEVGCDCGFGEKNSGGFGMVEVRG